MHNKQFAGPMNTLALWLAVTLAVLLTTGCGLVNLVQKAKDTETINPSGVIVTETREVSDFRALDMRTLGRVVLTQGDSESLSITSSDNVVPLILTRVENGVLIIEMEEHILLTNPDPDSDLIFEITLSDLTDLTVSGLASVEMDALTTSDLKVTMSGAGSVKLDNLSADSLDVTLSGLGNVETAGRVTRQEIDISGAGQVDNGDLRSETADITVPGLGSATIWVTERLTGSITGSGTVRYYGSPQTEIESKGLGAFEALGGKE